MVPSAQPGVSLGSHSPAPRSLTVGPRKFLSLWRHPGAPGRLTSYSRSIGTLVAARVQVPLLQLRPQVAKPSRPDFPNESGQSKVGGPIRVPSCCFVSTNYSPPPERVAALSTKERRLR